MGLAPRLRCIRQDTAATPLPCLGRGVGVASIVWIDAVDHVTPEQLLRNAHCSLSLISAGMLQREQEKKIAPQHTHTTPAPIAGPLTVDLETCVYMALTPELYVPA